MKVAVVALLCCLLVPGLVQAQEKAELNTITSVRVEGGRVEITGTKKPNFATFTMADPARLVIDISEAAFSGVPEELRVGNGVVTAIRTASYGSDDAAIARVLIGFEKDFETDLDTSGNTLVVTVLGMGEPIVVAQATLPTPTETQHSGTSAAETAAKAERERQEREAAEATAAAKAERERDEREAAEAAAAAKAERERDEREAAEAAAAAKVERERQEREAAEAATAARAREEAERREQAEAERRSTELARQAAAEETKRQQEAARQAAAAENRRKLEEARAAAEEKKRQEEAARQAAAAEKRRKQEEARAAAEETKRQEEAARQAAADAKRQRAAEARAAAVEEKRRRQEEARAAADAKRQREEVSRQTRLASAHVPSHGAGEESAPANSRRKTMSLVGFQPRPDGSRIFIRTNEPVSFSIKEGKGLIVLELENTSIQGSNNTRALDTSFFDTPVSSVVPTAGPAHSVRVNIRLKRQAPYRAYQDGGALYLEFPR